jgi:hypothetical protein
VRDVAQLQSMLGTVTVTVTFEGEFLHENASARLRRPDV